jgi:hypothetical protein
MQVGAVNIQLYTFLAYAECIRDGRYFSPLYWHLTVAGVPVLTYWDTDDSQY